MTPANGRWLIDKSAYVRLVSIAHDVEWHSRMDRGLIHINVVTLLELGFSARSGPDWEEVMHSPPVTKLPIEAITPMVEARAVEVQGVLARSGHHRAPSVPDLLIAATAELADLTVLHHDKDFSLIASITGQPVEQLGPA